MRRMRLGPEVFAAGLPPLHTHTFNYLKRIIFIPENMYLT